MAPYYAVTEGIELRHTSLKSSAQMHHKFAVIDGKFIINGSFNWTTYAAKKNHENIMVTSSRAFARQFNELFDRLWGELPYELTKQESRNFIKTEEKYSNSKK
jgi:phosphatidylserine/phosphatidylglycerophosphate/cardiolipin synthase-like enzyme